MTPLISFCFSPKATPSLCFDILVLRNTFIPRQCRSHTSHRQDITQQYVPVSSNQTIPVDPQAELLQQEESCTSSLLFPSFPTSPPSSAVLSPADPKQYLQCWCSSRWHPHMFLW